MENLTTVQHLKPVLEALIMVAEQPLSLERLCKLLEEEGEGAQAPGRDAVRTALGELQQEYAERGVELVEVASGFRFQARATYAERVSRLWEERKPRYSRAQLETLALIAYRQPITRGEIEHIRGVAVSSNIIRLLIEREWVRVVGHRDVPGRPAVYATTKEFLDYFGLKSLAELPTLGELKDFDAVDIDLFAERAGAEGAADEASGDDARGAIEAAPPASAGGTAAVDEVAADVATAHDLQAAGADVEGGDAGEAGEAGAAGEAGEVAADPAPAARVTGVDSADDEGEAAGVDDDAAAAVN